LPSGDCHGNIVGEGKAKSQVNNEEFVMLTEDGVMLSLRSIWRGADVKKASDETGTRQILRD
jgi:hypothetical protein